VATDFEHRSYSDELRRCQRYFLQSGKKADGTTPAYSIHGLAQVFSADQFDIVVDLPVQMRATPSVTFSNIALHVGAGTGTTITAFSDIGCNDMRLIFRGTAASHGDNVGQCAIVMGNNNTSNFIHYNAEL